MNQRLVFLYGPPGSGKTAAGRALAQALRWDFHDLDSLIVNSSGMSIADIFESEGETGFRQRERTELTRLLAEAKGVCALGGGALLNPDSRTAVEQAGVVLILDAPAETLHERLRMDPHPRPLLTPDPKTGLANLLAARNEHYSSFPNHVLTQGLSPEQVAREAQVVLGAFQIDPPSMLDASTAVRIQMGGLETIGSHLREHGLAGPVILVSDTHVGPLYARQVLSSLERSGYTTRSILIPAGERTKNLQTVAGLWKGFLSAGMERGSTVLALGGGVVGDLAGFAASTYKRGAAWVVLPTSLLAMVDASLGGKTGIDLPEGKNLVGAFHPPRLVLADPKTLATLPDVELRSGLVEALKHGIIADQPLFDMCTELDIASISAGNLDRLERIIHRAVAVKVQVIQVDPYEKGWRAVLNLGHTIGHALELASGYRLRHGEAVAIGLVIEARLAEAVGVAEPGLADGFGSALARLGLPIRIPPALDLARIREAIAQDKKMTNGRVRFPLPVKIGQAMIGIEIEDWRLDEVLGTGPARAQP